MSGSDTPATDTIDLTGMPAPEATVQGAGLFPEANSITGGESPCYSANLCNAECVALEIFGTLVNGTEFLLPEFDMNDPQFQLPGGITNSMFLDIPRLTNDSLTTRNPNGTGTFDWIMRSIKNHLEEEYQKGRITGADYTNAYIALTQAALSTSVTYLVQRDQAYWASVSAQLAAVTANVNLTTAKMNYAVQRAQAYTMQANFALTTLKLSTEAQTFTNLVAQWGVIREQHNVQLAQTSDARTDGMPVVGVLGKQKQLIAQQITSYQRDAEVKAAKLFSDGWTVQKTVDEGLLAPDALNNASVNTVLQNVKVNNNLNVDV
jgi:hypothetical protein